MKNINLVYLIIFMETYSNYGEAPRYMMNPETFEVYPMDEIDDFQQKNFIMIPKVDIYKLQLDFIYNLNSSVVIKKVKEFECAESYDFSTFFHNLIEGNEFYEYLGRDVSREWSDTMDEALFLRAAQWCEENHFPYEVVFTPANSGTVEAAKEHEEKIKEKIKKGLCEIKANKQVDLANLFCYVENYPNLFESRNYFMNPKNHKVYDEDDVDDKNKSEYLKLPQIDVHEIELKFIKNLNSEVANETLSKIDQNDSGEYIDFIHTLFETPIILGKIVKDEWDQFLYNHEKEELSKWCEENDIPYKVKLDCKEN